MCTIIKNDDRTTVTGYKLVLKHKDSYYSPIAHTLIKEGKIAPIRSQKRLPLMKEPGYSFDKSLCGYTCVFKQRKDARSVNWINMEFYDEMLMRRFLSETQFVILKMEISDSIKQIENGDAEGFIGKNVISFKEIECLPDAGAEILKKQNIVLINL